MCLFRARSPALKACGAMIGKRCECPLMAILLVVASSPMPGHRHSKAVFQTAGGNARSDGHKLLGCRRGMGKQLRKSHLQAISERWEQEESRPGCCGVSNLKRNFPHPLWSGKPWRAGRCHDLAQVKWLGGSALRSEGAKNEEEG